MALFPTIIQVNEEVQDALASATPVVALESTIITHGMPYPKNIETALTVEHIVREEGAIPATIAVIDGIIRIGLTKCEIDQIGQPSKKALKLSARDLAYAIEKKCFGGTTVAATIKCAHVVGIPIFATGGIGGVHRDGQNSLDISADLYALANHNMAVVCAGAKSSLDIGLTLEVLETLSVLVVGYQSDYFPSFYSHQSPFKLDYRLNSPAEIASIIKQKKLLKDSTGILIGNPIPKCDEVPHEMVEELVQTALKKASQRSITGKQVTPFLLSELANDKDNKFLNANTSLIKNNAQLAAKIARHLSSSSSIAIADI